MLTHGRLVKPLFSDCADIIHRHDAVAGARGVALRAELATRRDRSLRLDLAQDHAAPAQMQLCVITDDDQLERDHPLTGGGWLHEQSPIELERERALAAPADRVHLGDDLRPPAIGPVGWDQAEPFAWVISGELWVIVGNGSG